MYEAINTTAFEGHHLFKGLGGTDKAYFAFPGACPHVFYEHQGTVSPGAQGTKGFLLRGLASLPVWESSTSFKSF